MKKPKNLESQLEMCLNNAFYVDLHRKLSHDISLKLDLQLELSICKILNEELRSNLFFELYSQLQKDITN